MVKAFSLKYKLFLLIAILLAASCFFIFKSPGTKAGILDNVDGFAYNATYGLISFNCSNFETGEIATFPYTFPFTFASEGCVENPHGVDIGDDGYLTGHAWNTSLGLIDFGPATSSPAFFASSTNLLSGWAWIESLGADGWINLSGLSIDPATGDFHGTVSTATIGDIKFNCADDSSCGTVDHRVHHYYPIVVSAMSAPNWSQAEACAGTSKQAIIKWQLTSGTQSIYQTDYQIVIDDDSDMADPVFDSGKITSGATQYTCPNLFGCTLNYGTEYYVWVKFWDARGEDYGWVRYDHDLPEHTLTEDNGSTSRYTFATYKHEFPNPYFSYGITDWKVGDEIIFSDASQYYTAGSPDSNPQDCSEVNCDYLWSTDVNVPPTTVFDQASTTIVFYEGILGSVALQITDGDAYICSTSTPAFDITFNLPFWKEINPNVE